MTAAKGPAITVLGGGLMGLAIAHQCARRGEPVRVLSRRRSEAAGFVAAGMLAPHAEGLTGDLLALGQASLQLIPSWVAQIEADSGLSCGLRPCGIVVPFATTANFPLGQFRYDLDIVFSATVRIRLISLGSGTVATYSGSI